MKAYYVENLEQRNAYLTFLSYVFEHSDVFSLLYFKYQDSERTRKTTKEIKDALSPYKIFAKDVQEWPGTVSMDDRHIHRLVLYRADPRAKTVLERVEHLYEWSYSKYPMDLAFFKDGYAWFWSCAHEGLNELYLSDDAMKDDMEAQGILLSECGETTVEKLFFHPKAVL